MKEEITRLAREYTQETADLKDYQCLAKSAIYGRQMAKVWLNNTKGIRELNCTQASEYAKNCKLQIEECDPEDQTSYIWALVPEYNSHKQAKVVLRRVGTADGELLLPPEKRSEKRLKTTDKEQIILRRRSLKSILEKIQNYEGQIKIERKRLGEQIRQDDKVYMEACAIQLKRICENLQEDMDDFLDLIM